MLHRRMHLWLPCTQTAVQTPTHVPEPVWTAALAEVRYFPVHVVPDNIIPRQLLSREDSGTKLEDTEELHGSEESRSIIVV